MKKTSHYFRELRYRVKAAMPRLVARPLYRLLSYFLPVDTHKACFISFPDVADNALELCVKFASQKTDWTLVWLVRDKSSSEARWQELGIESTRVVLRNAYSIRGAYHALTARLVYHTHGMSSYMTRRSGQFIVNLFHGMPLKSIGTYDVNQANLVSRVPIGDVTIATSELFQKIMAKAFALPVENVWLTGQPRTDRLVRHSKSTEMGYILWMPTYRISIRGEIRRDSDEKAIVKMIDDFRLLNDQLAPNGPQVLVKLHPMDYLNSIDLPELSNVQILRSTDARAADLERLMAGAKALISDFSSAAIDFAILNRPIGFYVPDKASYTRGLIDDVMDEIGFFGTIMPEVSAIADFVTSVENGDFPKKSQTKLHKFYDEYASDRVIEESMNIIQGSLLRGG